MRFLKVSIVRDTRQGKKVGGGTFKRYSDSYRKWLVRKGFGAGKKWLSLSGKMMRDMKTRTGRTRAQVGYWQKNKSTMLANVQHKGRRDGTIPARPWVGLRAGYTDFIGDRIIWPYVMGAASKAGFRTKITQPKIW